MSLHLGLDALEQIKINELEVYFSGYSATPLASREIRVEKSKELNYYQGEVACNVQQMQAVKNIVNHTAYPFPYLVIGGSGTGKTTVLIESIIQILLKNPDARIMVSSQSNSICDKIAFRLRGFLPDYKIYRFYSMNQKFKCNDSDLDYSSRRYSNLDTMAERFHTFDYFRDFRVFVTTLTNSVNLPLLVQEHLRFSHIFIDDANNCTETNCLIPIVKYFSEFLAITGSIVLFGDPRINITNIRSKLARDLGLGKFLINQNFPATYSQNPH
jgi:hypothetical protein